MLLNILLLLFIGKILFEIIKNKVFNKKRSSFLSIESSETIKGIATIMIVFSHVCQYEKSISEIICGGRFISRLIFSWGAIGTAVFFILSGYGCYIAINKTKNPIAWTLLHIVKLLIHFSVAFMLICIINIYIFKINIDIKEIYLSFIRLCIPTTSTWYLKMLILLYLYLLLSVLFNKNKSHIIVTFLIIINSVIFRYVFNFPDYWWKTSLCFAAGCIIGKYRNIIFSSVDKKIVSITALIFFFFSFLLIMKDYEYKLIIQLPSYVFIASYIIYLFDKQVYEINIFKRIGKMSLDIYMIHIGIVETIFTKNISINIKVLIFIIITFFFSTICNICSDSIYNKIYKRKYKINNL